jgi:hypothetical protein
MNPYYSREPQAGRIPAAPGRARGREQSEQRPNWWLRLTSSGWDQPLRTAEDRERMRRSRLMSWIILGIFVVLLVLTPGGLSAPATLLALGSVAAGLVVITILNRIGQVVTAGFLLVLLLNAAILYAVAGVKEGLSLIYLPAFDLFVITVVVAASVLPRTATFVVAALNVGLIIADFVLQPHAQDIDQAAQQFGAVGLLDRPVALQVIIAVVAFLWVRGTEQAIRRADRAEEIAALEHTLADQKRQLDMGIQQILQTHVRAANGDYTARAPLGQDNILWQIASSLNNLLSRLQRSGQAEHQLRRTDEEIRRLAAAIDDAQAGRKPIWPAPTGTAADLILERIRGGRRSAPQAIVQEQSGLSQPMSGFPGGPRSGWPEAMSQQMPPAPGGVSGWPDQMAPAQQPMEPAQNVGWPGQQPAENAGWPETAGDQGAHDANPWAFPQDER